jgi:hypothetical protein
MRIVHVFKSSLVGLTALILVACSGVTNTESAARTGALIGGLTDGWGGAATGAIIGGAVGLAVDYSGDKKKQSDQAQRELDYKERQQRMEQERLARMQNTAISEDPKTAYRPSQNNQLVGSTWRIVSLVDDMEATPDFKSWIISFPTNSRATTLVLWEDGRVESYVEKYSVTSDALILSGTYKGESYITNARFSVQDNQMVIVTNTARVVLEEVEEGV